MRGLACGVAGSEGGCAGWEACRGMCGVVGGGKREECAPAPGRHLGVCVGLVQLARRSWGRCDDVSVLEKKKENSFGTALS